jgi:DNA-binding IclR family transcriptional regulator
MAMTDRPPRSIDSILGTTVDSVGAVELLLLLRSANGQPRSVGELCAALGSPVSWTEQQLEVLGKAGLAVRGDGGDWRYTPSDARLAAGVDDLAAAWRRDSSAVRRWVFAPRRRSRRPRTA